MHVPAKDFGDASAAEEKENALAPHVPDPEEGRNGEIRINRVLNVFPATDQAKSGALLNYIEILG